MGSNGTRRKTRAAKKTKWDKPGIKTGGGGFWWVARGSKKKEKPFSMFDLGVRRQNNGRGGEGGGLGPKKKKKC